MTVYVHSVHRVSDDPALLLLRVVRENKQHLYDNLGSGACINVQQYYITHARIQRMSDIHGDRPKVRYEETELFAISTLAVSQA